MIRLADGDFLGRRKIMKKIFSESFRSISYIFQVSVRFVHISMGKICPPLRLKNGGTIETLFMRDICSMQADRSSAMQEASHAEDDEQHA